MDKLFEFITDKIGYTAFVILGFLFPGILFVFVWNRELFLGMELVKLILLALSISFMLFAVNFLCTSICFAMQEAVGHRKEESWFLIGFPAFMTDIEISCAVMYKLSYPGFSISQLLEIISMWLVLLFMGGFLPSACVWIARKFKKIRNRVANHQYSMVGFLLQKFKILRRKI